MKAEHERRAALLALALLSTAPSAGRAQMTQASSSMAGRSTVYAPEAIVATSQPLASAVALQVLAEGGNAVDAAVAAAAVLNVVEPNMTGIGGDMFALLWSSDEQRLVGLDGSGLSGSLMTPEALPEGEVPYRGPGSISVPGALSGWAALLERYGTRTLAEVLAPAIRIADEGFPVTPIIAGQWAAQERLLSRDPGASATFLHGGRAPAAGEWFRNPDLAESFRLITREGPSALYGGELGRRIVENLRPRGGFLTLDDLRDQHVRWVEPISTDFRGYTVWELPPAGQGVAALQMLELLEPYDLVALGHNSAAYLHLLIEAKKLAFADLDRYLADPSTMDVKVEQLLDSAYVAGRRQLIDERRAAERVEPGELVTASETVYLTVADRHGNMVSFINSIYEYFGSGIVVPGTGFALQNRAAGFTAEPGHPNVVAPRKRPFHTLIPGFVTRDGQPYLSFGVMGGSMQPQGHVQFLLNHLIFGMDLQAAIDANRFRHMGGLRVAIEGVGQAVRDSLAAMGHELIDDSDVAFGGAQAIERLERGWAAGSDPRKDGLAIGR